jgi:hypothetical protein
MLVARVPADDRPGRPPTGPSPTGGPGGAPRPEAPLRLDELSRPMSKEQRAERRRQQRIQQRVKTASLVIIAVVLLGAIPGFLIVRDWTRDPVFNELDALSLPAWAAGEHTDAYSGSRLCIGTCRFRERTWQSEKAPDETQKAYDQALKEGGWRPRTEGVCPAPTDGIPTCWHRDEYVLDMWVRAPICETGPARPTLAPSPGSTPGRLPEAKKCPGSLVTVKVSNAVSYHPNAG